MPTATREARILSRARDQTPAHVLIAGGGVAGLEALLALHDLAGDRVKLTLLTSAPEFVYRPMAIAEPFGRGRAEHHLLADIVAGVGAKLVRGELIAVDGPGRTAITSTGQRLRYDALLVAIGAGSEPAFRRTLTWTPETDAELFGGLLRDLEEGYTKRVAFVVPPGVAWALPAYELALMTAWQVWGMGHDDVEVTVYTPEDAPLGLFGPQATAALRHDLEEAGVQAQTGVYVAEDPHIPGRLLVHPGARRLETGRVVALPQAVGPRLAGLPADARGFVLTDRHGKVPGVEAVWAAGDAIAFPVKQGGLASQQADAAAEAIAADVGADVEPRPFRPVLRGMMLTGRGKAWMRNELAGGDGDGTAQRRALWWPPTKIAGRYLSPYLATLRGADPIDAAARPDGHPVELDLERELPSAADTLPQASPPREHQRARPAPRRAEARRDPHAGHSSR